MRIFIILNVFFTFTFNSCQTSRDKLLIKEFVENYLINNTAVSTEGIDKYLNISDYKKKEVLELVKFFLEVQQKEITNNNNKFEILNFHEVTNSNISHRNTEFPTNYQKIYFLIANNKEITFFIIEKGKIISFFSANIQKKETDKFHPFFLNQKNGLLQG